MPILTVKPTNREIKLSTLDWINVLKVVGDWICFQGENIVLSRVPTEKVSAIEPRRSLVRPKIHDQPRLYHQLRRCITAIRSIVATRSANQKG